MRTTEFGHNLDAMTLKDRTLNARTDAFIVDAVRTPIGRLGGALAGVRADDLLAGAFKALLQRVPNLDPALIDEHPTSIGSAIPFAEVMVVGDDGSEAE